MSLRTSTLQETLGDAIKIMFLSLIRVALTMLVHVKIDQFLSIEIISYNKILLRPCHEFMILIIKRLINC